MSVGQYYIGGTSPGGDREWWLAEPSADFRSRWAPLYWAQPFTHLGPAWAMVARLKATGEFPGWTFRVMQECPSMAVSREASR